MEQTLCDIPFDADSPAPGFQEKRCTVQTSLLLRASGFHSNSNRTFILALAGRQRRPRYSDPSSLPARHTVARAGGLAFDGPILAIVSPHPAGESGECFFGPLGNYCTSCCSAFWSWVALTLDAPF